MNDAVFARGIEKTPFLVNNHRLDTAMDLRARMGHQLELLQPGSTPLPSCSF